MKCNCNTLIGNLLHLHELVNGIASVHRGDSVDIWAQVQSGCGSKGICGEGLLRKFIIIMSDAREEAAIAREALVRGKKKQKKQTTLMTKWNIVLDYGESGVSMADY